MRLTGYKSTIGIMPTAQLIACVLLSLSWVCFWWPSYNGDAGGNFHVSQASRERTKEANKVYKTDLEACAHRTTDFLFNADTPCVQVNKNEDLTVGWSNFANLKKARGPHADSWFC